MKYNFEELIDIPKLQELTDELYMAASIASAIVTMDGEVLTGSGWQRLCTDFHRQHPEIEKDCIESDTKIRKQLDDGELFAIYKCPRGLVDASSPVIIAGEHVANVFAGQILLEPPDETTEQFFREQARKFGFDETEYIKAFKEIPIFTENKFRAVISFLAKLAQMVAEMGLKRLNELESMEALRNSEKKFRSLFECINDSLFVHLLTEDNLPGHFIEVNDMACKKLGYSRQELLQLTPRDISAPDDGMNPVEIRNKLLAHGSTLFETMHLTKEGQLIPVESHIRLLDYDGQRAVLSIARDITERKQAEEALRKRDTQFANMTSNVPGMLYQFQMKPDGTFSVPYSSSGTNDIFGFLPEEVLDSFDPIFKVIFSEDQNKIKQTINESAKNLLPWICEYRVQLPGKPVKWVYGNSIPKKMADGSIVWSGYNMDITERKKSEEEKIKAQKIAEEHKKLALVGQVAGKMAHDFNNILGIIMGNTELSLMDCKDEETKKTLELIFEQTIRGKNLTKNLVAFAKDHEPKQEFFRISEKIDLVLNLMRKDLEGIELRKEESPDVPELLADPGMIEHALVNLIQNSTHALSMVEFPRITLRTYSLDNKICFEIEDNGCGISKENLENIYEPSFTLKGSRDVTGSYKSGIKGTGYGMANIKKYVEQHKGAISIESEVGVGATFTICLPVIKKELTTKEKAELKKEITQFEKYILLVEDEMDISNVQYRTLTEEPCNHKVDVANTGKIGMDLFDRNEYDFVSLDYVLPGGINGMDVYHHIRKTNQTVPVLFISGNIEFLESIKELKQKDAYIDHLSKPCQNKDYINGINELLEKTLAEQ